MVKTHFFRTPFSFFWIPVFKIPFLRICVFDIIKYFLESIRVQGHFHQTCLDYFQMCRYKSLFENPLFRIPVFRIFFFYFKTYFPFSNPLPIFFFFQGVLHCGVGKWALRIKQKNIWHTIQSEQNWIFTPIPRTFKRHSRWTRRETKSLSVFDNSIDNPSQYMWSSGSSFVTFLGGTFPSTLDVHQV